MAPAAKCFSKPVDRETSDRTRQDRHDDYKRASALAHHHCGEEDGARLVGSDDGAGFTSAVGSYLPNAFELYDMIGNVWELVADCWYEALPRDRHAHTEPGCERGGSCDDYPRDLRAARRSRVPLDYRGGWLGFRVARSLAPSSGDAP